MDVHAWNPQRVAAVAAVLPEGTTPPGTRGRILLAALTLYAETGFHGTSIRAIATKVGINSATLYAHYPSKEQVLADLVLVGHRELHDRLTEAAAAVTARTVSPVEEITALLRTHVLLHTDYPLLATVINNELHALSPELAAPALELRAGCRRILIEALERGLEDGVFQTPDPLLAATAIGSMNMQVARWFGPDQPYTRDQVADAYVRFALRIIGIGIADPSDHLDPVGAPVPTTPIAITRNGTVRGAAENSIAVFKGIPYAAPPAGPNRFQPPRPVEPWIGERDATAFGATAPKGPYAPPFDVLVPENDIPGPDFLNLNVWTPASTGPAPDGPNPGLPVMVFIHGGAFSNGSGSVSGYDGTHFARDGVVLVTVNYRLGVDGFLYLGDSTGGADGVDGADSVGGTGGTANLGLLDQIAALRWVQDNIAAFGGDPANVTVFGESAGAMSIGVLLTMPQTAGLFHRAILESGASHHTISAATAQLIARKLAEKLGIDATLEAFADVPLDDLVIAQQELRADISANPDPAVWGEVALNLMPFEPVIDGTVLTRDPITAIAGGAGADVDILIGNNAEEFHFFLIPTGLIDLIPETMTRARAAAYGLDPDLALTTYRATRPDANPGDLLSAIGTDWFYRLPAIRLAESHAAHRTATTSTYMYEFAWRPPTFDGRLGACHVTELPFVFDNLHEKAFAPLIGDEPPQTLADFVHAAWIAFATHGDPGWGVYDTTHRKTMRFDTVSEVVDAPRDAERTLWDGIR